MAEINTQFVIDAITLALRSEYPDALILDDTATQGIQPGTFIVQLINASHRRIVGRRFHRTAMFDVIYFSDDSTEECIHTADTLTQVLAMVTTPGGDVLHGSGMDWRTEDYVLHFMVSYNHYVLIAEEQEAMETLEIVTGGLYE